MITDIEVGDITFPDNPLDIIIGMNPYFKEMNVIGRSVKLPNNKFERCDLGSLVTCKFDNTRNLHMIICHEMGKGGWVDSDKYLRFGLDRLWFGYPGEKFSIVKIGTGPVGLRDGADFGKISKAISDSYLNVQLYQYVNQYVGFQPKSPTNKPFIVQRVWSPIHGNIQIAA